MQRHGTKSNFPNIFNLKMVYVVNKKMIKIYMLVDKILRQSHKKTAGHILRDISCNIVSSNIFVSY